jgi:hypothetical protein
MARCPRLPSVGIALLLASFVGSCGPSGTPDNHAAVRATCSAGGHPAYGDYAGVTGLRRADSHVDIPSLIERIQSAHMNVYAYLLWGWQAGTPARYEHELDDFTALLPAAEQAGIEVWAVLPSRSDLALYAPPPCAKDYLCWGRTLSALAAAHPNFTTISIDDLFTKPNIPYFTPDLLRQLRAAARTSAPLQLRPIGYFTNAMNALLQADYGDLLRGIIFVNTPHSIDATMAFLPDELRQFDRVFGRPVEALNFAMPDSNGASAGDSVRLSKRWKVGPGPHSLSFGEGDDLFGKEGEPAVGAAANGARLLELSVDGRLVHVRDLNLPPATGETPGYQWRTIALDPGVTEGQTVTITFALRAATAVPGVPVVRAHVYGVEAAGLTSTDAWTVGRTGATTAGWSAAAEQRHYRGKTTLMVYASPTGGGWSPDPEYIEATLRLGQTELLQGSVDGLLTYQLDKVDLEADQAFARVSALYGAWSSPCGGPDSCRPLYATCQSTADCCAAHACVEGACCTVLKQACAASAECCNGHACLHGACCATLGQTCGHSDQCCSGHCTQGRCGV